MRPELDVEPGGGEAPVCALCSWFLQSWDERGAKVGLETGGVGGKSRVSFAVAFRNSPLGVLFAGKFPNAG